jgi:hypothetical protein
VTELVMERSERRVIHRRPIAVATVTKILVCGSEEDGGGGGSGGGNDSNDDGNDEGTDDGNVDGRVIGCGWDERLVVLMGVIGGEVEDIFTVGADSALVPTRSL